MTDIERTILWNQVEIMQALATLLRHKNGGGFSAQAYKITERVGRTEQLLMPKPQSRRDQ